jgi:hypothetical protein
MDFFLSDRIYWIYRIFFSFSQFPPARHWLFVLPSLRGVGPYGLEAGKDKGTTKIMSILFILSNILRKINQGFFHE